MSHAKEALDRALIEAHDRHRPYGSQGPASNRGGKQMTMSRRRLVAATALTAFATPCAWPQTPEPGPAAAPRALRTRFAGRFTGDFDAMLDRRLIRLVVPYSPTLFFEDKGTIYGTAANGGQLFEEWVNKTFALRARPLTVLLTPVSRDKLFDTLLAGDGDMLGATSRSPRNAAKKWPSRCRSSATCAKSL